MDSEEENLYFNRILKRRISTTLAATKRWFLKKMVSTTAARVKTAEEVAEDGSGGKKDPVSRLKKHYKILKEENIRQLQDNNISELSSVLSVSRGVACTLLCRQNWSLRSAYDESFADEGRAREPINGIWATRNSQEQVCKICYEETRCQNMFSAGCGHPFCADCWNTYIAMSIKDGPGCLKLLCPEPACKANVGLDMVDWLASEDDKEKYHRYLYQSYVEGNRNRKWCPAPGCDLAIEFDGGKCKSYDVTCDCSYKFCWNCTEESHRPVDCKTAAKWTKKNSSEAENTNWILANTKPCPKCRRPIQKIDGCNHMTCLCRYEFCWACLGAWGDDDYFHLCYKLKRVCRDKSRLNAKTHLERYTHYFERWDSNEKFRKRALVDLYRSRNMLANMQKEPDALLQCVAKAWEQVVECRLVLKWSYVYGYYLSLKSSTKMNFFMCPKNDRKMNFFECLQGEAEAALERLHDCAEAEMARYLDFPRADLPSKLVHLTEETSSDFENFVVALENNLSGAQSYCPKVTTKTSKNKKPRKRSKNRKH